MSRSIHSQYERVVRDLPADNAPVLIRILARRFKCLNQTCSRKIFCERLKTFVAAHGQRSFRLTGFFRAVGFATSAENGARLTAKLQAPISSDTLIRILRSTPIPEVDRSTIIGVDDWALKRGQRYGTIIVDHETGRPVDLLLGRTSKVLEEWLRERNGQQQIDVVTRDRSSEYTRAISAALPMVQQVADRWHLLLNMREAMQRLLARHQTELVQSSQITTNAAKKADHGLDDVGKNQAASAFLPLPSLATLSPRSTRGSGERAKSELGRLHRKQRFEQVQAMKAHGGTISEVARVLHLSRVTARKYFYAPVFPERRPNRRVKSFLDAYVPHLQKRFDEGCRNASQLWREVHQLGFTGTPKQVRRWVFLRRESLNPTTPKIHIASVVNRLRQIRSQVNDLPSTKQLAWLFVKPRTVLTDIEQNTLQRLLSSSLIRKAYDLSQRFCNMVKSRQTKQFDKWLTACTSTGLPDLVNFADGIRADYAAVRASLETAWSNARAEGHVNRVKMIKRMMFGRANFDLLRLRVLHPPG